MEDLRPVGARASSSGAAEAVLSASAFRVVRAARVLGRRSRSRPAAPQAAHAHDRAAPLATTHRARHAHGRAGLPSAPWPRQCLHARQRRRRSAARRAGRPGRRARGQGPARAGHQGPRFAPLQLRRAARVLEPPGPPLREHRAARAGPGLPRAAQPPQGDDPRRQRPAGPAAVAAAAARGGADPAGGPARAGPRDRPRLLRAAGRPGLAPGGARAGRRGLRRPLEDPEARRDRRAPDPLAGGQRPPRPRRSTVAAEAYDKPEPARTSSSSPSTWRSSRATATGPAACSTRSGARRSVRPGEQLLVPAGPAGGPREPGRRRRAGLPAGGAHRPARRGRPDRVAHPGGARAGPGHGQAGPRRLGPGGRGQRGDLVAAGRRLRPDRRRARRPSASGC